VYFSTNLIDQLNLTDRKSITLRLGKYSTPVTIRTIKRSGKHIFLPQQIRNTIHVPHSGSVMLSKNNDTNLKMGPLIGILTDSKVKTAAAPFGARTTFIRQLIKEGENKAFVFAFTPSDINWEHDRVNGYFISNTGSWVRKIVPLPDVVYNRLPSRRAETSPSIGTLRERFIRKRIPFFNWSFFTKTEVYQLLQNDADAEPHVPESITHPTPEEIKSLLEKHQFVYLKPTGGSLGVGIYRLTYHKTKGYFVRYRSNGKNVLLRFNQFNSLIRMLNARHKTRLQNYVLQQGIRLIEIDGCPIDFRFHMHKNGKNEWVIAGIGAKKAGRGSVTTHLKNGGTLMTPEQVLGRVFGEQADDVLRYAKQVAIKLAKAIERNYPHLLGEIGFDLGIDRYKNVWMFEANAKPGRTIFKHPSLKTQGKASLTYIFEHCLYLSQFRTRREE
jgi:hypothetical protein